MGNPDRRMRYCGSHFRCGCGNFVTVQKMSLGQNYGNLR